MVQCSVRDRGCELEPGSAQLLVERDSALINPSRTV